MKKHSFIVEITIFLLIFLFFALPPLFYPLIYPMNDQTSLFSAWSFPWRNLILCLLALFVYISYNDESFSFIKLLPAIFTLGLLFFTSLVFKAIDVIFIKSDSKIHVDLPVSFTGWLFCILSFLFSAFYEEVLYRFYLCESLINFLERKASEKTDAFKRNIRLFFEIVIALLFAFAHLYLGWLSVINALAAHIILRITYKKSRGIWSGFAAHFIYNIISLILL